MRILRGRTLLGAITLSVGAALCATPAATAAGPATAASGYRVVDLGTLGSGGHSDAIAINNRGHIAGTSNGHAVLWRNGHIIDLGVLPGARDSYPLDLNDRDEVVGSSTIVLSQGEEPETTVHAFVWRNGRMRDLGALPGGDYSVATGINNRGDIVGRSSHQTGPWGSYYSHAVLWRNGGIVELESDEVLSYAEDITNDGWIVGSRGTPADPETYTEAVAWKDGRATVLYPGDAVAANERHQAIGSHLAVGSSVLWSRGVVTDVGRPPGDAFVMAADINNRGQVVGWAESGAFVWHQGTAPTVLPDLGGSGGASAAGINDRGQIVGGASLSDIEAHAVLWTR